MSKRHRSVSASDGPTLPFKLLDRVKESSGTSHHNRDMAVRAGPSRKALRRQKKQLKKKNAIMLSEQMERRARKKRGIDMGVGEEDVHDDQDVEDEDDNGDVDNDLVEEQDLGLNEEVDDDVETARAPASAYVPPHLRGGKTSESMQKSIRGILNKLAEGTLFSSAAKIADLVVDSSRSEVIDCLCFEMVTDTAADAATSVTSKLVAVFASLIGILYHEHNMGLLLPSTIAEQLSLKFDEHYMADDAKRCLNVALFLGYLFQFSVIGSTIVLDLCKRLAGSFGALDVELLLKLMQLMGMKLRGDVPGELVALLQTVVEKTAGLKASAASELNLRTQFMSETLANIKNNRYMHNDEHLTQINKALKIHRGDAGSVRLQVALRCSWSDLVEGRSTGQRWWLRAGAEAVLEKRSDEKQGQAGVIELPADLKVLARRLRITTETRKQVFAVVMTAEGYADAFEKLERLKLQGKADRDVVFVLCECCVSEQIYNMFYGLLAAKLSEYHKSYGLTFQYHIWDQIRGLSRFQETGRRNFALFVRDLLANNCVSLLVLKPVDFLADMGAELKQFVNLICSSLIADASMTSEAVLQQIFQGLSRKESEDIKLLREGVLLFLRFSLVFRKDQANEGNRAIIKRRLKLAKEALAHVRVVHKGVHQEEDEE